MTRKKLAIILATLVILATGALLLLPAMVDVNRYRGLIQSKAEETLGRKVTLGEMTLTVLPTFGIQVENPSVENLLAARSLTVGARILPLLFGGSVELTKVILDQPEITLTRGSDGVWDAEDLAGAEQPSGSAPGPPRPFSLSRLKISRGLLHVRGIGPHGSPAIDVSLDLDGSIERDESGALSIRMRADLASEGSRLAGAGSLESSEGRLQARIDISDARLDLERAREVATAAGMDWPLPEGLLASRGMIASGQVDLAAEGGTLRKLSLESVQVGGVEVALHRNKNGRWNFESLMEGGAKHEAGKKSGTASPSLDLRVRSLELAGATVRLIDDLEGVTLILDDLEGVVAELSADRPLTLEAGARVAGGGRVSVKGDLPSLLPGEGASRVAVRVEIDRLDVASVAPYLRFVVDLPKPTGTVTLQGDFEGLYPDEIRGRGSLRLDGVTVMQGSGPVTATAEFDAAARHGAALMEIHRLAARYESSSVELKGTIDNRGGRTRVDLVVPPASIEAKDLVGLAALSGTALPVEFDAGRPVRLEGRIQGEVRDGVPLDISGSVEVADAMFRHPSMSKPMQQVSGKVTLGKDAFEISGFSGVIGGSDIAGTLAVADLDSPRVTFDLRSNRADFWELMSFLNEEDTAAGPGGAGPASQGEDLLGKVSARGTLAIARGAFHTLDFQDLSAAVRLESRLLTLDPVEMNLYGGSMTGSATMDMGRPTPVYTVIAQAETIDTDALISANLGMKDTLAGALSGRLEISASGQSQEQALRAASGGGRISLADGRVGAINVLKALTRASDVLGEKSLKQVSDKIARQGTEFSSMTATLQVRGGQVSSKDLRLVSPDLELTGEGVMDMLAATMDISGQIIFSEPLTRAMVDEKSRAAEYFWDPSLQRVNLPLKLSGPIEAPMPNIDWKTAGGKLARRKIEDNLETRLEKAGLGGLLKGKEEAPSVAPVAPAEPEPGPVSPAGDPAISISRSKLSGNFLLPDLKVKGALSGTGITSAVMKVRNKKGSVIHESSLMDAVRNYYAANDPGQPARIEFSVEVDGKELVGARSGIEVTIEVADGSGRTATKTFEASR